MPPSNPLSRRRPKSPYKLYHSRHPVTYMPSFLALRIKPALLTVAHKLWSGSFQTLQPHFHYSPTSTPFAKSSATLVFLQHLTIRFFPTSLPLYVCSVLCLESPPSPPVKCPLSGERPWSGLQETSLLISDPTVCLPHKSYCISIVSVILQIFLFTFSVFWWAPSTRI